MTPFEWVIGSLVVGLYLNGHLYYRSALHKIKEVKDELMILRTNDLHAINEQLSQFADHIFSLAKEKK